MYNPHSLTTAK